MNRWGGGTTGTGTETTGSPGVSSVSSVMLELSARVWPLY